MPKNVSLFNCRPETELASKQKLKVRLNKPRLISNGFFRKNTLKFGIFTEPMGWKVIRAFEDFKWLHDCLKSRFPANYLPDLPEVQATEASRDLDKFYLATYINHIVNSPDLVYSHELCCFLKMSEQDFIACKKVAFY